LASEPIGSNKLGPQLNIAARRPHQLGTDLPSGHALALRALYLLPCSLWFFINADFAAYLFSRFRRGQIGHLSIQRPVAVLR
jgi:hypothetical protein